MTIFILNIVLSIVPVFIFSWLITVYAQKRKYRRLHIFVFFFIGGLAVFPSVILEHLLIESLYDALSSSHAIFIRSFFIAAFVEESIKFLLLAFAFRFSSSVFRVRNAMFFALLYGIGFACVENLFHVFQEPTIVFLRAFLTLPLHMFSSLVVGYFLGKGILYYSNTKIFLSWLLALIIHGLFNLFIIMKGLFFFLTIPYLLFLLFYIIYLMQKTEDQAASS